MSAAVAFALPSYQQTATDKILRRAATDKSLGVGSVQNLLATEAKKQPPRGQLTDWDAVRAYVFAGKAVFTLHNPKTGVRLTYKVTAKKEDLKAVADEKQRIEQAAERGLLLPTDADAQCLREDFVTYFVTLLRGQDNVHDFAYMGVLRKPGSFFITTKSQVTRHPTSYKALVWFLDAMRNGREILGGKPLEFWHSGRCGCCGRMLTVPESVARGVGPECWKGYSR
jgi:hypothetical protein